MVHVIDRRRLGRAVRERRLKLDMSLDLLAAASGVDKSTISKLENAKGQRPGLDVVLRLAEGLRLPGIDPLLAEVVDVAPTPSPAEQIARETAASFVRELRTLLGGEPDGSPPAEQAQERQALGDKYLAHPAAPAAARPPHAGHSTRRRISPELMAA